MNFLEKNTYLKETGWVFNPHTQKWKSPHDDSYNGTMAAFSQQKSIEQGISKVGKCRGCERKGIYNSNFKQAYQCFGCSIRERNKSKGFLQGDKGMSTVLSQDMTNQINQIAEQTKKPKTVIVNDLLTKGLEVYNAQPVQ